MNDIPPGIATIVVALLGVSGTAWGVWFSARRTSQRERQRTASEQLDDCRERIRQLVDERIKLVERNAALAVELAEARRGRLP